MSRTREEIKRAISPGDLLVTSQRWLEEHPDAPLRCRVAVALTVAARGDVDRQVSVGEVAEAAGCDSAEILPALRSLLSTPEKGKG